MVITSEEQRQILKAIDNGESNPIISIHKRNITQNNKDMNKHFDNEIIKSHKNTVDTLLNLITYLRARRYGKLTDNELEMLYKYEKDGEFDKIIDIFNNVTERFFKNIKSMSKGERNEFCEKNSTYVKYMCIKLQKGLLCELTEKEKRILNEASEENDIKKLIKVHKEVQERFFSEIKDISQKEMNILKKDVRARLEFIADELRFNAFKEIPREEEQVIYKIRMADNIDYEKLISIHKQILQQHYNYLETKGIMSNQSLYFI